MVRELRSEGHSISVLPLVFGDDNLPNEVSDWWHLDVGSEGLSDTHIEQIHEFSLRSIILLPIARDDPFKFAQSETCTMLDAVSTSKRRVLIDPGGQFLNWASDTEDYAKTLKQPTRDGVLAQEARYAEKLPRWLQHADLVTAKLARHTAELVTEYASPEERRSIELGVIEAFAEVVLGTLVLRASLISPPAPHPLNALYKDRINVARERMRGDGYMASPYLDEGYYQPIFERYLNDGTFVLGEVRLFAMEIGGLEIRPIRSLVPGVMFSSMEENYTRYAVPFDPRGEILDGHFLKIILWQIAVYAYFNFPRGKIYNESVLNTTFGWSLGRYNSMGMA